MSKNIKIGLGIVLTCFVLLSYSVLFSPTKIGMLNFPEFMSTKIMRSIDLWCIDIEVVEKEDLVNADQYDMLYLFGMGLKLTEAEQAELRKAEEAGTAMYLHASTNKDLSFNTLKGDTLNKVKEYLDNSGNVNYRNLMLYTRRNIDGKIAFADTPELPVEIPSDVFFYKDNEVYFEETKEFERYCLQNGFHKQGNKKAILFTSIPGPFNSNREYLVSLIEEMEARNINIYPVAGFLSRLDYMEEVDPDLIVYIPHGRLSMMGGASDQFITSLKRLNVPMLCPVTVHQRYDDWLKDKQGLVGGLLSQSVTMPEFDGGIAPYAVFAQYEDENGYLIFKAIPNRLKKFGEMAQKYLHLQDASNGDKKVAIVYLKGPGKNALEAADMEVLPSLHNTLLHLKSEGYNLGNLPSDFETFKQRIMTEGPVLGTYAEGAFDHYLEYGKPELIPVEDYNQWSKEILPQELIDQINTRYGKAPGSYMRVFKNGKNYIAVTRVKFGNVVLLPQPLPGLGDDSFALVHGAKVAPPHTYIAPYLWIQKGFKADAIVHYGTHGSLEFTPGKQIALSDYDWTDPLIGTTPHNYIYTMGNIGEAMIAKRRSYAAILSHLTSPFMEAEALSGSSIMKQKLKSYDMANGALKRQYGLAIKELIIKEGYHKDLGLDDNLKEPYSEDQMANIESFLIELDNAKVSRGLYTLGKPYTDEQLGETAWLMHYDALATGMQEVAYLRGEITRKQYHDENHYRSHFLADAKNYTKQVVQSNSIASVQNKVIAPQLLVEAIDFKKEKEKQKVASQKRMMATMEKMKQKSKKDLKVSDSVHNNKSKEELSWFETMKMMFIYATAKMTSPNENVIITEGNPEESYTMQQGGGHPSWIPKIGKRHESMKQKEEAKIEDKPTGDPTKVKLHPPHTDGESAAIAQYFDPQQGNAHEHTGAMPKKGDHPHGEMKDHPGGEMKDHPGGMPKSAGHPGGEVKKSGHPHGTRMVGGAQVAQSEEELKKERLYLAVNNLQASLESVLVKKKELAQSTKAEFETISNALNGGFVVPSSGGDPIANPDAIITGKNLYSISAEKTPTKEAWDVAKQLTHSLLEDYKKKHENAYPEKISFTLWAGSFIESEGATIGQILYLLGVEPIWTPRGGVSDIRIIPEEELGRPRIDVIVQTSGQLRDLAASRLFLIQRAIDMVAKHNTESGENFVAKGALDAEMLLIEKGFSPKEARMMATQRVFGNNAGGYGTGIMGMVENSGRWDSTKVVAKTYINNMGAVYGSQETWANMSEGLFEAALLNTEAVVQPRQSNSWGALSLDHVYEFMGGINLAVREVTGNDAESYFNDFRNSSRPRIQGLKEAVGVESRTTILNPKYIKAYMEGGASSAATFAEIFRNTFGWEVMKPSVVEDQLWNDIYDTYVEDKHNLNIQEFFKRENPYALQEMTAVMLETARKGYWEATSDQIKGMTELHADLVKDHEAGCSGFVCDNDKLRDFITDNLNEANKAAYEKEIKKVRESKAMSSEENVVLKKQESEKVQAKVESDNALSTNYVLLGVLGLCFIFLSIFLVRKRRK